MSDTFAALSLAEAPMAVSLKLPAALGAAEALPELPGGSISSVVDPSPASVASIIRSPVLLSKRKEADEEEDVTMIPFGNGFKNSIMSLSVRDFLGLQAARFRKTACARKVKLPC